jgi:heat-inducible transcriptional repressor
LAGLRDHLVKLLKDSRDEVADLRRLGLTMVKASIDGSARVMDVVVEGQSRLLERTDASTEHLRELLRALDDREKLVGLLDSVLSTERVQVFLGEDTAEMAGMPVSLVAAPYADGGYPGGAVGVLGPTRMDYARVVPIVGATADAMSAALSLSDENKRDGNKRDGEG